MTSDERSPAGPAGGEAGPVRAEAVAVSGSDGPSGDGPSGGAAGPVRAGQARPSRPAGAPGMGSIFVLAFLVILVPGLVAYSLLRWAGLAIGPAGLLGLLIIFLGLGFYPALLQRLGWVRRRARRTSRNRSA